MTDQLERQRAHFNTIADTYYLARQSPNHLLLKDLMWRDFLAPLATILPEKLNVLEAMCGFADAKAILEKHLERPVIYSGFDYSDAVVHQMQQNRPDIAIQQQDVTKFVADTLYDLVVLLGGLHHGSDQAETAIGRLAAAIKPGGFFLNLEPTHGNAITRAVRERLYKKNSLFDAETERAFYTPVFSRLARAYTVFCDLKPVAQALW